MRKYLISEFDEIFGKVDKMVGPGKLPTGILGIADKDGIIALKAYGTWPDGKKVREDDIYLIFSITKPVTALAVMQLWEKGKLHLDEPVSKYIHEFKDKGRNDITIWNLLTHTSGIQEGAIREIFGEKKSYSFSLVEELINVETNFTCGSHKSYNTMAFSILGEIIGRVSGMECHEYMEKYIFKPLGLEDTSFNKHNESPERVMPIISESYFDMQSFADLKLMGAGLFSTAHDLLILAKTLLNNGMHKDYKLISPLTLKEMTTPQTVGLPYYNPGSNIKGCEIGLSWFLPVKRRSIIKHDIYGHNGAGDSMFWVYPSEGLSFVFMTNYDFSRDPEGADIDYIHNVFTSCLSLSI